MVLKRCSQKLRIETVLIAFFTAPGMNSDSRKLKKKSERLRNTDPCSIHSVKSGRDLHWQFHLTNGASFLFMFVSSFRKCAYDCGWKTYHWIQYLNKNLMAEYPAHWREASSSVYMTLYVIVFCSNNFSGSALMFQKGISMKHMRPPVRNLNQSPNKRPRLVKSLNSPSTLMFIEFF